MVYVAFASLGAASLLLVWVVYLAWKEAKDIDHCEQVYRDL
jgi:hypothetical protein